MEFIAEIGLNYEGNLTLAQEMVRQAKRAGADAVKFQFGWRSGKDEVNYLNTERAAQIKSFCAEEGVPMFASVISEEGFAWAKEIGLTRFKIASRTVVDNPDLCLRVLAEGKLTDVSLGMWGKKGVPFGKPGPKLRYIYCKSQYPSAPEKLVDLPQKFSLATLYGYSDHCLGIEGCLLAIARGAQYVEKHFTLNKASQSIRDHVLSATPEEFKRLVEVGRPLAEFVRRMEQAGA
jgi:N,N'-diacetyllegionaminate synthase